MAVIVRVERRANRGDHAVQHPAGRDDVRARIGVRDGHLSQNRQRLVVEHIAFVQVQMSSRITPAVEQAAVAVVRIFAQTDVGDHDQFGQRPFDGGHGLLDDTGRGEVLQPHRVLVCGDAE